MGSIRTWTASFGLVVFLVPGCGAGGRSENTPASVLIICVDAMRADRIGAYGYERPTTPNIDALARDHDAVVYRNHYAHGAHTKASTASLFSGLFGFQHGVTWSAELTPGPGAGGIYQIQILDDRIDPMAERMRRLGFHTLGVTKSQHLVPEFGYAQGFDEYASAREFRNDGDRTRKVLELAEGSRGAYFGYLHLSSAHHPFPANGRDPTMMATYGFEYDEVARKAAGVDENGQTLEPDDVRFLQLIYDAKLRAVDEQFVGRLIEGLKTIDRYDDTMIIVTADHGEELYDHAGYAHGHALWDEVVRVRLIVKFPRGHKPVDAGREVPQVTQSIDLIPSLVVFFGGQQPEDLPGTDIFYGPPRASAFSEIPGGHMLRQRDHKLIETARHRFLGDMVADPGETANLWDQDPERVAEMRAAVEAVRSLGYVQ